MFPEWVIRILESLGLAGVVIFFLLMTVGGLVAYIKTLHAKADKVYGYRLAERDTLNKALTDTAQVLAKVLEQNEDTKNLTEAQAELIAKQAQAFELLKVTILAQYDTIKEHNAATNSYNDRMASIISALAESIRTLSTQVLENRTIAQGHVQSVNASMNDLKTELIKAIRENGDANIKELRTLLGNVTRIEHRRKKTP